MQEKLGAGEAVVEQDLAALGVAAAARAIRNGEVKAEAYAAALLERASDHADLKAFITVDEASVLEAARAADITVAAGAAALLTGVPIGVKDSYLTRGLRTTVGVSALGGLVPDHDAECVAALKEAGGIVFGKANLVEMSFGLTGINGPYGQVRNPHDRDHVSGGSSSGSAAAVAARLVPASFGGDTIGSIRVPASLCGVVGFKPTNGRWPGGGVAPISHTLDTTGVFARNVEDCILVDRVVTRSAPMAGGRQPGLEGVRLAFAPRQYLDLVDEEVAARFQETINQLRDAGAVIVEVDLGEDFSSLALTTTWNIFFRETRDAVAAFLREHAIPASFDDIYGSLRPRLKDVWSRFVVPDGPGFIPEETYRAAVSVQRAEIQRRYAQAFAGSGAQALIFPTTPCTAPSIAQQSSFFISGQEVSDLVLANHTIPASAAGLPGISIPIGLSRDRLPIGMELDGPRGSDVALLDLARRVEAVVGTLSSPV